MRLQICSEILKFLTQLQGVRDGRRTIFPRHITLNHYPVVNYTRMTCLLLVVAIRIHTSHDILHTVVVGTG